MNVELLEHANAGLGKLSEEVVFLGAATIPLWLTDPAAPPPRPTKDVDLVVEVFTLLEYQRFEARLREAGFRDHGSMIGRFLFGEENRQFDVIPADASILGFENRWQRDSLSDARWVNLPSGARIKALPPPNLLARERRRHSSAEVEGDGWPDLIVPARPLRAALRCFLVVPNSVTTSTTTGGTPLGPMLPPLYPNSRPGRPVRSLVRGVVPNRPVVPGRGGSSSTGQVSGYSK